jgi:hypothetical protein
LRLLEDFKVAKTYKKSRTKQEASELLKAPFDRAIKAVADAIGDSKRDHLWRSPRWVEFNFLPYGPSGNGHERTLCAFRCAANFSGARFGFRAPIEVDHRLRELLLKALQRTARAFRMKRMRLAHTPGGAIARCALM